MRRTIGTLSIAGLLMVGLAACASAPEESETPTTEQGTSATGPERGEADAAAPAENADVLCASGEAQGGKVCVVKGQDVDGPLSFEGYDVVKLIDTTVSGDVTAGGLREIVITGSRVDGDLTVTRTQGVVVKLTQVGGSVEVSQAQHATFVRNEIGADLTCDGVRSDGDGNQVAGENSCPTR